VLIEDKASGTQLILELAAMQSRGVLPRGSFRKPCGRLSDGPRGCTKSTNSNFPVYLCSMIKVQFRGVSSPALRDEVG
jgi:hypothetical protein